MLHKIKVHFSNPKIFNTFHLLVHWNGSVNYVPLVISNFNIQVFTVHRVLYTLDNILVLQKLKFHKYKTNHLFFLIFLILYFINMARTKYLLAVHWIKFPLCFIVNSTGFLRRVHQVRNCSKDNSGIAKKEMNSDFQ